MSSYQSMTGIRVCLQDIALLQWKLINISHLVFMEPVIHEIVTYGERIDRSKLVAS